MSGSDASQLAREMVHFCKERSKLRISQLKKASLRGTPLQQLVVALLAVAALGTGPDKTKSW